ncbi:hypothetical protein B0H14DRAFT_2573426 [Mycena olivaceomarginata]|nr:hypothetical protein B0H14DRAFT_2573426 [Mycena olivaceomarginata]
MSPGNKAVSMGKYLLRQSPEELWGISYESLGRRSFKDSARGSPKRVRMMDVGSNQLSIAEIVDPLLPPKAQSHTVQLARESAWVTVVQRWSSGYRRCGLSRVKPIRRSKFCFINLYLAGTGNVRLKRAQNPACTGPKYDRLDLLDPASGSNIHLHQYRLCGHPRLPFNGRESLITRESMADSLLDCFAACGSSLCEDGGTVVRGFITIQGRVLAVTPNAPPHLLFRSLPTAASWAAAPFLKGGTLIFLQSDGPALLRVLPASSTHRWCAALCGIAQSSEERFAQTLGLSSCPARETREPESPLKRLKHELTVSTGVYGDLL